MGATFAPLPAEGPETYARERNPGRGSAGRTPQVLPPAGPSHLTPSSPGEAKPRPREAPGSWAYPGPPNQKTAAPQIKKKRHHDRPQNCHKYAPNTPLPLGQIGFKGLWTRHAAATPPPRRRHATPRHAAHKLSQPASQPSQPASQQATAMLRTRRLGGARSRLTARRAHWASSPQADTGGAPQAG